MATITVIQGSDQVGSSRTTINNNFANLNTDITNVTSARTTYTPTVSGTGGTVGSVTGTAKYKIIGKTCHCIINIAITKGSLTGRIYISLPVNSNSAGEEPVSCLFGISGTTPSTSYGYATPGGNSGQALEILASIGNAGSWASISSSTVYLKTSFTYETV